MGAALTRIATLAFPLLPFNEGIAVTNVKPGLWIVEPHGETQEGAALAQPQADESGRRRVTNIRFGGVEYTSEEVKNPKTTYLMRPGSVKAEVCDDDACYGCADEDQCWIGKKGDENNGYGRLKLEDRVRARTSYVAEVYARCPEGAGVWSVYVKDVKEGTLKVYTDLHTSGKMEALDADTGKHKTITIELKADKETRIRVAFFPIASDVKSKAEIYIDAAGVDEHVDECMSTKQCLKILGDGSKAGYKLRNVNKMQLACLEGDQSQMSAELQDKCDLWNACMSTSTKKAPLTAFLRAGLRGNGNSGSSLDQAAVVANHTTDSQDPNTCVDPSADDAEAWDCECLDDMVADCEGNDPLEDCLRARMCEFDIVCSKWKTNNCEASTIQQGGSADSSAMLVRQQVVSKNNALNAFDSELDSTTQGKCSQ